MADVHTGQQRTRLLNTGGPCIKYNKIRGLRTKIRVLFVFKSLKDETPLVFSILVVRGGVRARLAVALLAVQAHALAHDVGLLLALVQVGLLGEAQRGLCVCACV